MESEPVEPVESEPFEEEKDEPKYHKDDYTLNGWDTRIEEEQARWRHIGINLDQLNYSGSELFQLHAKVQAITNCMIEGDMSEENMNKNLKMILLTNLERIRESVEPQIQRLKLLQGTQQPIPPEIIMPWLKKEGNGGS